ncbi:ABC transporter substrate-binding protein [Gracilibacillus phocaeensis]|nr:ABC transporter substrate-binding protein [Gracilibacillus phocaeensis]
MIGGIIGYFVILIQPFVLNEKEEETEQEPQTEDKVEITFWRNYGNEAENQAYNQIISDFHQIHPNITVNMQNVEYNNYEVKLRTEIVTEKGPDVMAIDSPYLALYAESGVLTPLDHYLSSSDDVQDDFSEQVMEGLIYNDQQYLMPLIESSIALYYNIPLLEDAGISLPSKDPSQPLTWEETIEMVKTAQSPKDGVYGIDPAQGFGNGEAPAYFKLPFLWQFGAEVLNPEGTTASGYLDSPEAISALQFYQDLYHEDKVAEREIPAEAFQKNQLVMTVLGSWAITEFENNGFVLGEDFGIAPLPKAEYQVTPNGSWALGMSSNTEYPEEAWEFIRYVTSYEATKKYVTITGDIPARYSVAESLPVYNKYPYNIFAEQAYLHSKNRPVTPAYPVISRAIKELFENIGLANQDVETSVAEAVETINQRLAEIEP